MIRALKPGSQLIAASVPDGRTDRMFFKLSLRARRYESLSQAERHGRAVARAKKAGDLDLVWIHLSKWDLPDDMWNEGEEARWETLCGGRGTNLWKWNVDGADGDPEEAVFSRALLQSASTYNAEYRVLRLTFDEKENTVMVECFQSNAAFGGDNTDDLVPAPNGAREVIHGVELDIDGLLAAHLKRPKTPYFVGGGDFGYLNDPTELLIEAVDGEHLHVVARVELLRCPYAVQAKLIAGLDRFYGCSEHGISSGLSHGWGFDATGVGTAVHSSILEHIQQPDQVSGWVWNRTTPKIDPRTQEPELDDNGREVTVSLKEQAVTLAEFRVQQGRLGLSYDRAVLDQLENYTSSISTTGRRRFKTVDDHCVDAHIAAELRLHVLGTGAPVPSLASVAFETGTRTRGTGIGVPSTRELGLGNGGAGVGLGHGAGHSLGDWR